MRIRCQVVELTGRAGHRRPAFGHHPSARRRVVGDELPRTLADGDRSVLRIGHQGFADRFRVLPPQDGGREVVAVGSRVVGQRSPGESGERRHKIDQTEGLGARPAGPDAAGPNGDERHPVTTLPDVRLKPAPGPGRAVAVRAWMRTVVACEDDQRVVSRADPVEDPYDFAHAPVGEDDQVPARAVLALALDEIGRKPGSMGRGEAQQDEKRRVRRHCPCLLHEGHGLLRESKVDLLEFESRRDPAFAGAALLTLGHIIEIGDLTVRDRRHAVAIDEDERPVHRRAGRREESRVEAMVQGTAQDGLAEVHVQPGPGVRVLPGAREHTFGICGRRRESVGPRPAESQVPFAEKARGVAPRTEDRGNGRPVPLDERGGIAADDPSLEPGPPAIAARENSVARGRADGRGRMGVGEPDAPARQPVAVRRRNLAVGIIGLEIPVAEVVGQDENDVGWPVGRSPRRAVAEGERRASRDRGSNRAAGQSLEKFASSKTAHDALLSVAGIPTRVCRQAFSDSRADFLSYGFRLS